MEAATAAAADTPLEAVLQEADPSRAAATAAASLDEATVMAADMAEAIMAVMAAAITEGLGSV